MTSREMASRYRLGQWAQAVRACRESGQTARAWCAEHGINEKTYYYWQNKLRKAACEQMGMKEPPKAELIPNGWAQVATAATSEAAEETLMIEIGSIRIKATGGTSPELLAKVCRALVPLC